MNRYRAPRRVDGRQEKMTGDKRGRLVIVSGPSGAGKTTLLDDVFRRAEVPLVKSVSATTRKPRAGEVDGVDYHFITDEDFQRRRQRGEFLECFQVFAGGNWYGTLNREVEENLESGKWVVLEIDVQGAEEVGKKFPQAITIFVSPGDSRELERRLRGRGTESEEDISRRLQEARREMDRAAAYQYLVINDQRQRAAEQIVRILNAAAGD